MNRKITHVHTGGIQYLEPVPGTTEWYWSSDYTYGDLYEAEELYRQGHRIRSNRLVLVKYPEGQPCSPMTARNGQYFGRPIFWEGKVIFLLADFPAEKLRVLSFDGQQTRPVANLPLSSVPDCYNLMLHTAPLMLTRQGHEDRFQIVWPEQADFAIESQESFCFALEDDLYFTRWHEDPDYREETVIRDRRTGEIREVLPGGLMELPDGQVWRLD